MDTDELTHAAVQRVGPTPSADRGVAAQPFAPPKGRVRIPSRKRMGEIDEI